MATKSLAGKRIDLGSLSLSLFFSREPNRYELPISFAPSVLVSPPHKQRGEKRRVVAIKVPINFSYQTPVLIFINLSHWTSCIIRLPRKRKRFLKESAVSSKVAKSAVGISKLSYAFNPRNGS